MQNDVHALHILHCTCATRYCKVLYICAECVHCVLHIVQGGTAEFHLFEFLSLCNTIHALHCVQDAMAEPLTQELHLSVAQLSALGSKASCSSLLMSLAR